ncbi:unnamed protein product [Ilex paraguariensis]|uniref:Uncharacterized protein n=1 Tax=Ilex paraguariensis TaxID=185542 RepID=A0ABC8R5G0_9AQUA
MHTCKNIVQLKCEFEVWFGLRIPSVGLGLNSKGCISFLFEIENSGSKPKSLAFTSKELLSFTNNFDERNRIGSTQFGELYRGKFQHGSEAQDVAVKIWNEKSDHLIGTDDYLMAKECNPILFDFGLLSGGIIGGPRGIVCDVFSYGVIVLGHIAKRLFEEVKLHKGEWRQENILVDEWANSVYKPNGSLVHSSVEKDLGYYGPDAPIITQLGMRCVTYFPPDRPTMKEVVECLEHLQVVEHHGDALASGKL